MQQMRKDRLARRLSMGLMTALAVCAVSVGVAAGVGADETTVLQATPQIVTQASDASITMGETITDTATVTTSPGSAPPTGTITFVLFGPNDPACTGSPFASSLNRPIDSGGTATSGPFRPTAPGTYNFVATYSGDANYLSTAGQCNDPNETVVVEAPPPPMPTTKAQCMSGGWRTYGVFKNQGDCVSFVATKGKNAPAGPKK